MLNAKLSRSSWSFASVALITVAAFSVPAIGQEAAKSGVVSDWSTHHVVFSNPGTREDAVKKGTLEQWNRITSSPRFQMQQARRSLGSVGALPDMGDGGQVTNHGGFGILPRSGRPGGPSGLHPVGSAIDKDWTEALGTSGKAELVIAIGTLSSSSISGSSVLTVDGTGFDASAPTGSMGTLTENTVPGNATTLVLGGITYNFSTAVLSATQAANTCAVSVASGSRTTTYDNLIGATYGTGGSAQGTGTWECNADVQGDLTVAYVSDVNTGKDKEFTSKTVKIFRK